MNRFVACCALLVFGLAGCSEGPAGPDTGDARPDSLTVNASAGWAYVTLGGSGAQTVSVSEPTTSSGWDIAFFATTVSLNGGSAGPGGVLGYCVCGNLGLTDAQVGALRPADALTAWEAVSAAQIPAADSLWRSDALSPAIAGWWSYNPTTHQVSANPAQVFFVRLSDGQSFAKLHVTQLTDATQNTAGRVTVEYALQASKGAPMGAVQSMVVEVPQTGRVYLDLNTGTLTQSGWDLAFEGYNIRINGGVSGSGAAGALASTAPFAAVTDASAPPAEVFRADAYGGIFDGRKWYRYNITGNDNQIWPTYDVYLIKRGTTVYKVQLINYYDATGQARRVTFRYARLAG